MGKIITEINAETDRKLTRHASRIGISKNEAKEIAATKGPDHFREMVAAANRIAARQGVSTDDVIGAYRRAAKGAAVNAKSLYIA